MYFLYSIKKKELGSSSGGWIQANDKLDALTKLIATKGVSEHQIELSYQCSDDEFLKEWEKGRTRDPQPQ